nr:disease resistance protein TAO1-like [Ziziphus jujuba var. spinosa]
MGQGIVFDKNKDLVNHSRLCNVKDVCRVLERNTGTSTIEGILLNLEVLRKDVKMNRTAFSKMHNLRVLKITHFYGGRNNILYIEEEVRKRLRCPDGLEFFISDEIRYFHWDSYPLKYLPYLSPENLVEFIMRDSQLEQLWNEAQRQPPELVKLKKINLSFSKHLIQIPNFSRAINLQEIHLRYGTRLVHIPPFFRNLNKLQLLDMTECNNLEDGIEHLPINLRCLRMGGRAIKSLPVSIWELKYLEELYLYDCPNLRKIPEISNHMECLVYIALGGTEIEELPESIEHLTAL